MWPHSPFPCDSWLDKKTFKHRIIHAPDLTKKVVADKWYPGERCTILANAKDEKRKSHQHIRVHHGTCNARFNNFAVLENIF